jgi:hypothetical protein
MGERQRQELSSLITTELCHISRGPMTGETVEAKCGLRLAVCWNAACRVLPACTKIMNVAGRCRILLLYLFRDPSSRSCLSVTLIAIARFHVTITSSGGDWFCVLQLVSRLQRSYRPRFVRRLASMQLHCYICVTPISSPPWVE